MCLFKKRKIAKQVPSSYKYPLGSTVGFKHKGDFTRAYVYEVYLNDVSMQGALVTYLQSVDGVREIKQSEVAAKTLSDFNRLLGYVSGAIIIILLCAAVFWRPFRLFAVLHLLLAAYNLLPVDPLDGGRILRVLFGRRITYAVGFAFCGAIVVLSFHHALQSSDWLLFGAVCLLFLRLILQSGRCFFGASGIK